jgi:hypothetical protein
MTAEKTTNVRIGKTFFVELIELVPSSWGAKIRQSLSRYRVGIPNLGDTGNTALGYSVRRSRLELSDQ